MPSQKIPLFGGIIAPVHTGNTTDLLAAIPAIVASPADKALLPRGIQAYYEIHLWLIPGLLDGPAVDNNEFYDLVAYPDDNPAAFRTIWGGNLMASFSSNVLAPPLKILDGYPIRGNVTLALTANRNKAGEGDAYPTGPQLFGYYYRVGQGTQIQPERRFIGEPSPDANEVTQGLPLELPAGTKKVLHTFENNRIDEMSLAWSYPSSGTGPTGVALTFEDANNNPLIPGHAVRIAQFTLLAAGSLPNYLRDPQSVYTIYQAAFGGGLPTLGLPQPHHLSIENIGNPLKGTLYAHGYFTRR